MLSDGRANDDLVDDESANSIQASFFGNTWKPCFPSLFLVADLWNRDTLLIYT